MNSWGNPGMNVRPAGMMAGSPKPGRSPKVNEQRVMRLVHGGAPVSRAEIVRLLGLSAPTVSKVVASLLEAGLLEEFELPEMSVGRPPKKLRLAREKSQVLGIVIAPGTCWVVSGGLDGELAEDRMRKVRTPATYEALIGALAEQAEDLLGQPGTITLGAGICVPGLVNVQTNLSVLAANLPMLEGRSPTGDLAERLGIECVTLHSKHAICLAERHFGEVRGLDDFVLLDFSTGAGLGVVSGGRLLQGNNGFAGEIGHITVDPAGPVCTCGNRGCLRTVATDISLATRVSQRIGRDLDIDEVVNLARSGQLDLTREIDEVILYLSIGIATAINIFNPPIVSVHGRLFDLSEHMFPRLLEAVRRRTLKPLFAECRFVRAQTNKRQGAVAAIVEHLIVSLAPGEANPLGNASEPGRAARR